MIPENHELIGLLTLKKIIKKRTRLSGLSKGAARLEEAMEKEKERAKAERETGMKKEERKMGVVAV